MPTAATRFHNSIAFEPTNGRFAIHSGGAGTLKVASDFAHATTSSTLETIVPIAKVNGTTSTPRSRRVITVTASPRLPHSHFCKEIISGQVATTMVAAHTMAPRNGRKIHIEDPIRATMKSTASTPRAVSCCLSPSFAICSWVLISVRDFYPTGTVMIGAPCLSPVSVSVKRNMIKEKSRLEARSVSSIQYQS